MAQPITCDVCNGEQAVQLLSNLETGEVLALGPGCLPVFYGQSVLAMMDAGEHKGLPQKCQACRRVHERMTLAVAAAAPDHGTGPANVKDQPATGPGQDDDPHDHDHATHPEDQDGPDQAATP